MYVIRKECYIREGEHKKGCVSLLDQYLTPEEIAKHLSVTDRTVYTWLRTGRLKAVKLGRLWRIREKDLELFLNGSESDLASVKKVEPHNDRLTRQQRRELQRQQEKNKI